MTGGILAALVIGRGYPGFVHNGALAGLVAVCAGSNIMHPIGSFITGGIGGFIFVHFFNLCQEKWQIDDVLGVWPLHGLAGAWGGIAAGIFGLEMLGGLGGVGFISQLIGTVVGCGYALICGLVVYGVLKQTIGIRLSEDEEIMGADLAVHNIQSEPESGIN